MMKLYKPLCSDVTLRLVVDISPDDEDDVSTLDTQFSRASEHCDNENLAARTHLPRGHNPAYSSTSSSSLSSASSSATSSPFRSPRNQNQVKWNSANHNWGSTSVERSIGHYKHGPNSSSSQCSWYCRQNTPEKVAKDIYYHEHVINGDPSIDDVLNVPLDTEFKRSFEEECIDFKEVPLYEEIENRDASLYDELGENGNFEQSALNNISLSMTSKHQYSDAKLSFSYQDKCRFDNNLNKRRSQTTDNDNLFNDRSGKRRRRATGTSDACSEEMSEDCADDSVDDCYNDHDVLDNDDDVLDNVNYTVRGPDELPIDLDEDVDVVDKQVTMGQSMVTSYYGEIEEEELQKSMTHSMMQVDEIPDEMSKSIAEEIHDVILGGDDTKSDGVFNNDSQTNHLPFPYPFTLKHAGHLFEKSRHHITTASSKTPRSMKSSTTSRSTNDEVSCASIKSTPPHTPPPVRSSTTRTQDDGASKEGKKCRSPKKSASSPSPSSDPSPSPSSSPSRRSISSNKCSVSTNTAVTSLDLGVTHRGLHRFVPRHKDEMNIGIGDPIHVFKECDDLWCEGINLRTGEKGIFPAMYANDLKFLEESDDEEEYWKFNLRFLGSVEVTSHKGDETLINAINVVAMSHKGNVMAASLSALEINQYGIRMIDKSKEGHEKDSFSHFFALKNISFCGTHPKNDRYFAFITKHPRDYKFACHVFHGDHPTHRARDAIGEAFKRFYQEYMAFTHPTEDIYME